MPPFARPGIAQAFDAVAGQQVIRKGSPGQGSQQEECARDHHGSLESNLPLWRETERQNVMVSPPSTTSVWPAM